MRLKIIRQLSTFFFFFILLGGNFAQSDLTSNPSEGWRLIQSNQFLAAQSVFQKTLAKNPNDEDALIGLIFITEVLQDQISYKKYTNQLIRAAWQDEYMALFHHLFQGDPQEVLGQSLAPQLQVQPTLSQVDSLIRYRKFSKADRLVKTVSSQLKWSVIGPFENNSGSGHLEKHPPEKEHFFPAKIYASIPNTNKSQLELQWIQRNHATPSGKVYFNENLAYTRDGSYYANSFLTFETDQLVQFRVARNTPLKIWLDGDLIFEKNNNINFTHDGEIIELPIQKGTHRLLVKSSPYLEVASRSRIYLSFNDEYDEEIIHRTLTPTASENYLNIKNYGSRGAQTAGFSIRVTNNKGVLLENLTSSFFGKNKPQQYPYILLEKHWIQFFKAKILAQPADWKNYYLLAKAYFLNGSAEEGEAWLAKNFQEKNSAFFKYVFSKFLAANDKGEKAEALLSEIQNPETPVFANLINYLRSVDLKNNETNFVQQLQQLLEINPTHWNLINAYLAWMSDTGQEEERRKYVSVFLSKNPNFIYKKQLTRILSQNIYVDDSFTKNFESEREKKETQAIQNIQFYFDSYDYLNAIAALKRKELYKEAINLYDELIEKFPYRAYYRKEKANLYFILKKYEKALQTIAPALKINPYNARIIERIGDIYFEKNDRKKAMLHFQKAKKIDIAMGKGGFALERMNKKIAKLGKVNFTENLFTNFSKAPILKNNTWQKKYANSESVVLFYNIQARLREDNRMNYRQKLWIQIINQAGANYWTEADFSFLGEIEHVKVLKPDGSTTTPARKWSLVVFNNLEPGDIIVIEGNTIGNMTREIANEMSHISWLSMQVPIAHTVCEMMIPKEKNLNYVCNRLACHPRIRQEGNLKIYTWEFFDTPKNEYEEAVLDQMDIFSWLMVSTQNDWSKVVKWFQQKTYRKVEINYEIQDLLQKIIANAPTQEEQVEAIYNFLTSEITYSHVSFLNSNYTPKKPSSTISARIGDCKDVASLMIAMLQELGIEAWYVLVRTSNYTNKKPRPSVQAFNHVVVGYQLANQPIQFIDMTTDFYPNNVLPELDAHQWALHIRDGETDIFRLPNDRLNPEKSFSKIQIQASIEKKRNLEMAVTMEVKGVHAGNIKEALNKITLKQDRKSYLAETLTSADFDHLVIRDFNFENLNKISKNLKINLSLRAYNYLEKISNFQILQIPILHPITTRPALFSEKRYNNLDLSQLFHVEPIEQIVELEINQDFELLDIPRRVFMENKFGIYELIFQKTKKGIRIQRSLRFKTFLVQARDYDAFKKFYLQMLDADRTKLAIKKREDKIMQR